MSKVEKHENGTMSVTSASCPQCGREMHLLAIQAERCGACRAVVKHPRQDVVIRAVLPPMFGTVL